MHLVVLAFIERENNGLQDKKFVSIKNQEKQRYPLRIYVVQLKLLSFTHILTKKREPQVLN